MRQTTTNPLKAALAEGRPQIGLWQSLASSYTAEICAGAGFDWLLFDGEHGPNTVQTLLAQLQAVASYQIEPVARTPGADPAIIKAYLDIGFRSLLIPMVESADAAQAIVAATRFPPRGVRGVAGSSIRASRFGARASYLRTAHEEVFVAVQIESRAGLSQIEAVAAVEGIDCLFIGPSDLAASMDHLGAPDHPQVEAAIADALARIGATGKAPGVFTRGPEEAAVRIAAGARFVSVGSDVGLLSGGARALAGACRGVSGFGDEA